MRPKRKREPSQPTLASRTDQFKDFESALKRLNDTYWLFRCTSAIVAQHIAADGRLKDLVDADISSHLDITVGQMMGLVPDAELQTRQALLVQALTAYEDYLAKAIKGVLKNKVKSTTKYTIKLCTADLPISQTREFVKELILDAAVRTVIDAKYQDRMRQLSNLFKEHGFAVPGEDAKIDGLMVSACEARNCIIHSAGIADSRAVANLQDVFPGLKLGDALSLTEDALWDLVGAMRQCAHRVDTALKPATVVNKGYLKASHRKRRNPGNLHPSRRDLS